MATGLISIGIFALALSAQPASPIACAFDQLDETQRQVAAEAYLTTDALPRKAASRLIRETLEACPGFAGLSDKQVGLAIDYSQSAVVADLIEQRLADAKAPPGLAEAVWSTLDTTQQGLMLDFARNRAPEADMLSKAVTRLVLRNKGTPAMIDAVTMGLAARAILEETKAGW